MEATRGHLNFERKLRVGSGAGSGFCSKDSLPAITSPPSTGQMKPFRTLYLSVCKFANPKTGVQTYLLSIYIINMIAAGAHLSFPFHFPFPMALKEWVRKQFERREVISVLPGPLVRGLSPACVQGHIKHQTPSHNTGRGV